MVWLVLLTMALLVAVFAVPVFFAFAGSPYPASDELELTGLSVAGLDCPLLEPEGSTDPLTGGQNTTATLTMANAVIACFGRAYGVGCQSERYLDLYEHPRGRACDFMTTSRGIAEGDDKARGDALAQWIAVNAEEFHVLYVIWYRRVWNPSDGNIPMDQWRDYDCRGGCDPSDAHYNHVHVSIELMPGDPVWAECPHLGCSE